MTQTESQSSPADYRRTPEYLAAHNFLVGRINYERVTKMPYSRKELNLDRMARLLDLLGDPHKQVDLIHIAGTKGKGSTAAFLSSAFQAHGLRCGSYTSPHLHHVEERFRLNGQSSRPQTFVHLVQQIRPAVAEIDSCTDDHVTYFEIATALGFLFFLHQQVDVAVVEVGLGGRLDSTNVCQPIVSVITSISFDHMKQLGNTLGEIAAEKAGIIKRNIPVVSGVVADEPRTVIRDIAQQRHATLLERDKDFRYTDYRAGSIPKSSSINFEEFTDGRWRPILQDVELGKLGEHQAANASVALACLRLLPDRLRLNLDAIRRGFAASRCEARIEVVATDPLVIVDAAHNPASAQALVNTLQDLPVGGCSWLILATTRGKDVEQMLDVLLPCFDRVVCTRYENNPRGHTTGSLLEMVETAKRGQNVSACDTPREAWEHVQESIQPSDRICITGSFFIAAELREFILSNGGSNA